MRRSGLSGLQVKGNCSQSRFPIFTSFSSPSPRPSLYVISATRRSSTTHVAMEHKGQRGRICGALKSSLLQLANNRRAVRFRFPRSAKICSSLLSFSSFTTSLSLPPNPLHLFFHLRTIVPRLSANSHSVNEYCSISTRP